MDIEKFKDILDKTLKTAREHHESSTGVNFLSNNLSKQQIDYLKTIVNSLETTKSILAVLITSLIKKIEDPKQDIRLHREEFKGGYSGRTLDTKVVTPWLKEHFPRFAPKQTGWLTRSIEQPHPFTKDFPGKIKNKSVKDAFLSILDDVEEKNADAKNYLICLFILVLDKISKVMKTVEHLTNVKHGKTITINLILKMLEEHFSTPQSSRLPVIAIYSIYQILSKNVEIYKDKELQPLKPHTASDSRMGYGDIEVYYKDGKPFEIVEIKHEIPIGLTMIGDVLKKIQGTSIKRYFILTTAEPNFEGNEEEILDSLNKIKKEYNVDIIPNGVLPSLKYYLRLIDNPIEFVNTYTENLEREFQQTTDIKEVHIEKWKKIIEKYDLHANESDIKRKSDEQKRE
ncbi:MAG: DNA methyltransferase [Candidatus Micrarchaeia archaeon]